MKLHRQQDKHNAAKLWLIKTYKCGHVYVNQSIHGQKVNSSFQRTTVAWLRQVLN